MMKTNSISLYVHFPFCKKRCNYCDFYSTVDLNKILEYQNCVLRELELKKTYVQGKDLKSIFFGGGTPSLSDIDFVDSFIRKVKSLANCQKAEVTMELNPESSYRENLEGYFKSGVNRLSFGLQSTDDGLLSLLGRISDYREFVRAYKSAREIGFENINIDMMTGLPNQTLEMVELDLERIIELSPEHISWYSLILEENTKLFDMVKSKGMTLPDEEKDRKMVHLIESVLNAYGCEQYEISNFAKKGRKCVHNLRYWKIEDYLGLGASAASSVGDYRMQNIADIEEYIKRVNSNVQLSEVKYISRIERLKEYIIMGLRLNEGIRYEDITKRFGIDFMALYEIPVRKLVRDGLIHVGVKGISLSEKGRDLANVAELELYSHEI